MHRWRVALLAALLGLTLVGPSGADDSMASLLAAVAENDRLATPLRADGTLEGEGLDGRHQDRVVIVERAASEANAARQVLVELQSAKLRLLALGPSALHVAKDGKAAPSKPDHAVAKTTFTAEDWLPFSRERCAAMRLADLTAEQFTLVCEPQRPPSQYHLMVFKFDREKRAVRQVLLYKDTMTNLVKMLRYDEFVEIGGHWRPKQIVAQDFKLRTKDELNLDWQQAPAVGATFFDAKTFAAVELPQAAAAKKP